MTSREEILRLADLARITIDEARVDALAKDFEEIVAYISHIQEVGDSVDETLAQQNVFREDENAHTAGAYTEPLLSALPRRKGKSVLVRKVISHD